MDILEKNLPLSTRVAVQDFFTEEMIRWLAELFPYLTGEKKWDTGCLWVCESHPLMPYEQGYLFDCKCGAPGMEPIRQKDVVENFKTMCEESVNPDLFSCLVNEIIPVLKIARKELSKENNIDKVMAKIEKKDELIFAYDAVRSPIIENTIID